MVGDGSSAVSDDDKDTQLSQQQQLDPINNLAAMMTRDEDAPHRLPQQPLLVDSDWLSCLAYKTGLSRMSVVFLLFTLLVVLMWFIVCVVFPTPVQSDNVPQVSLSYTCPIRQCTTGKSL